MGNTNTARSPPLHPAATVSPVATAVKQPFAGELVKLVFHSVLEASRAHFHHFLFLWTSNGSVICFLMSFEWFVLIVSFCSVWAGQKH